MDTASITVEAPTTEVEALLRKELTAQEFALVSLSTPEPDPFSPEPVGDMGTAITVVKFAGGAIVGGVIYDVVKHTYQVLKARYDDRVKNENPLDEEPRDKS